jgi:hypothetical protein
MDLGVGHWSAETCRSVWIVISAKVLELERKQVWHEDNRYHQRSPR